MAGKATSSALLRACADWVVLGGPEEPVPVPNTRMVGGWIRWRRKRAYLPLKVAARRIGLSAGTLGALETGRRALTQVETAVKIADGLGVSREEMVIRAVWDFRRPEDQ
ncbi:helix-turn-helix domain-containing protein [Amycolatopsis sp. lyj-23]|uniref:helix-turn-helix domain-containing protein n=1 Tax=Amycolatopsis sp. lyj-23 TaxID=2789283 RepID=UPI00397B21EF